jgi:hypothetical protein
MQEMDANVTPHESSRRTRRPMARARRASGRDVWIEDVMTKRERRAHDCALLRTRAWCPRTYGERSRRHVEPSRQQGEESFASRERPCDVRRAARDVRRAALRAGDRLKEKGLRGCGFFHVDTCDVALGT